MTVSWKRRSQRVTVVVAWQPARYQCQGREIAVWALRLREGEKIRQEYTTIESLYSVAAAWDMIFDIVAEMQQRYEYIMIELQAGTDPIEQAVLKTLVYTVAHELRVPVQEGEKLAA